MHWIRCAVSVVALVCVGQARGGGAPDAPPRLPQLRVVHGHANGGLKEANAHLTQDLSNGSSIVFTPRGVNYIRLSAVIPQSAGYHSTFSPLYYSGNRSHTIATLDKLSASGFNVARVFIDHGDWSRTDGVGATATALNSAYLDNVADFITLASARGIYTNPTLESLPNLLGTPPCQSPPDYPYPNNQIMAASCVNAKAKYASLFVSGLQTRLEGGAGLSGIGWISIENEAALTTAIAPFAQSNASLTITPANGKSYAMTNKSERQMAADESSIYWADTVTAAAKAVASQMLVGVGVFTFAAVGRPNGPDGLPRGAGDPRVPLRPAQLSRSSQALDLLDVHVYQTPGWTTLEADLQSSEWSSIDFTRMPVIMGEFGAFREDPAVFPVADKAATAMAAQVSASCSFNFSGWMFWTYDTVEQPRLWDFVTAPELLQALSPRTHPDFCAPPTRPA